MTTDTNILFRKAKAASEKHYAPYSNFPVGAAIRSPSGKVYVGCNIENASYPEGWCAETSAISQMIMGDDRKISEIAVFAPNKNLATPCGGCRQRIAEFADAETLVHLCDSSGVARTVPFFDLLPASFNLEDHDGDA